MHARQPLVSVAGDVWSAAFKAHFIAFWLFAQSHQMRVSRLDEVQHAAIHGMNAATRLAAQLDDATTLAVQRLALRNASSGILSIAEVMGELGIDGSPMGTARTPAEGARLISDLGPTTAAKLLVYARAAWIHEEVLVVDLGAHTTALQARALLRRMQRADCLESDDVVEAARRLPMHATQLCACCECHRVANAYVAPGAPNATATPFNELGKLTLF